MGTQFKIGEHKLLCCSVLDNEAEEFIKDGFDMFYSDPPWDTGKVTYYSRLAGREPNSLPLLYNRIAYLISKYCRGYAFVEMGLGSVDSLMQILRENGLYILRKWDVFYGHGQGRRKYNLVCAAKRPETINLEPPDIPGNVALPFWAITNFSKERDIVFDSCCGLGGTGVACVKANRIFRGIEYVPKRIEKAVYNIEKEVKKHAHL